MKRVKLPQDQPPPYFASRNIPRQEIFGYHDRYFFTNGNISYYGD